MLASWLPLNDTLAHQPQRPRETVKTLQQPLALVLKVLRDVCVCGGGCWVSVLVFNFVGEDLPACVSVYRRCAVPVKARRGRQIHWNGSYRWL